jgi:hypothetical protein
MSTVLAHCAAEPGLIVSQPRPAAGESTDTASTLPSNDLLNGRGERFLMRVETLQNKHRFAIQEQILLRMN